MVINVGKSKVKNWPFTQQLQKTQIVKVLNILFLLKFHPESVININVSWTSNIFSDPFLQIDLFLFSTEIKPRYSACCIQLQTHRSE